MYTGPGLLLINCPWKGRKRPSITFGIKILWRNFIIVCLAHGRRRKL